MNGKTDGKPARDSQGIRHMWEERYYDYPARKSQRSRMFRENRSLSRQIDSAVAENPKGIVGWIDWCGLRPFYSDGTVGRRVA